jgi:hypothetical protein
MEVVVFVLLVFVYLFPALVSSVRKHHNRHAIWATNILLGWTGIGWAIAFIWAVTKVDLSQ